MKIITLLLSLILLIPQICVSADSDRSEFSINTGENFTAVYEWDEDKSDAAKKLGMSEEKLQDYFDENDVLMVAVNDDNTAQLRLSKYDNEFSELAYDISLLSDDEISELSKSITGTDASTSLEESNGISFITFSETHNDSGGTYTATQYITVFEGDIYRLSCYNQGDKQSDEMKNIFSTLKLNGETRHSIPLWQTLLIIAGIAVFAAVAAAMIIGIIKDRKTPDTEETEN